jgi:hypothetical protein
MTDLSKIPTDLKPTIPTPETEPAEPTKPTIDVDYPHSEWYYDPDGDLEIVASDGILIKLAAYRLQASSYVLTHAVAYEADKADPYSGNLSNETKMVDLNESSFTTKNSRRSASSTVFSIP